MIFFFVFFFGLNSASIMKWKIVLVNVVTANQVWSTKCTFLYNNMANCVKRLNLEYWKVIKCWSYFQTFSFCENSISQCFNTNYKIKWENNKVKKEKCNTFFFIKIKRINENSTLFYLFFFNYFTIPISTYSNSCHELPRSYTLKWACTIVLCCVMTQVQQVNCKLFVHADHSSLSYSGRSPMLKTIPHTAFSRYSLPYTSGQTHTLAPIFFFHLSFTFIIIWLNAQKYPCAV